MLRIAILLSSSTLVACHFVTIQRMPLRGRHNVEKKDSAQVLFLFISCGDQNGAAAKLRWSPMKCKKKESWRCA